MKSNSKNPRPLVVSLHTWSGDFNQNDTLVWQCVDRDYNYIHPNFRGPNRTVEACGSPLVISDIDDAIDYAIAHGNVDINEIHVIGSSGGGYATLLCYMQSRHHIKSFASWVPISNLIDWYNEVRIREPEHALDIAKATTGKNFDTNWHYIDEEEAKKRSPIYMQTATLDRSKSKLSIYAGVHDGFTGAVPITHSINMYNKLVMDNDRERIHCQVSKDETISLLTSRGAGRKGMHHTLADRPIHLQRAYKDMIRLTIFEGSHECLTNVALQHIDSKRMLTIGDSNGAMENGWVDQLKQIRFNDHNYNTSISGNTIGFMNNGDPRLNTLHNIDNYMSSAIDHLKGLDALIITLGTNDCKIVFKDSINLVSENLKELIGMIRAHDAYKASQPRIFIVSPPPFGIASHSHDEFVHANERMLRLYPELKKTALSEGCTFIDIKSQLDGVIDHLTSDGIHLHAEGQRLMAEIISQEIDKYDLD